MSKKHRKKTHYGEPEGHISQGGPGTMRVDIAGMHCASCEVLVERRFRKVPGVRSVRVSQADGRAEVAYDARPTASQFQEALAGTEYSVPDSSNGRPAKTTTPQDYIETTWVLGIVIAAYFILDWLKLVPKGLSVSENMSYPFIFAIGLVAAVSSCIAVTGGLLVAVGSRYAEAHPDMQGWEKFKPVLHFNIGRVVGYTVLGGLVGALGSAFTLSTRMTGVLSVAASMVMIFLGFQLLNIFPGLRRFQPKMPKFIAHRVHEASGGSDHPAAPFGLGAATFFLPCGFTQALQLYVLSKGSFEIGALTMLAFSLGTLPALLSLGALSSFLKGAVQRYFFRFAGVIVVLLGIFNISNGLALAGFDINLSSLAGSTAQSSEPGDLQASQLTDGKQVINMEVINYTYIPAHFKVVQGVPVEWHVDGSKSAGCAGVLTAPDLNVTASLPQDGEKVIKFTPDKVGTYSFSCPMGMTTRGASIEVVPNSGQAVVSSPEASISESASPVATGSAQQLTLTYTGTGGFSPKSFTAKRNVPVTLTVDIQGSLSGCMSTMVGSDYGIVSRLKQGKNTVEFTPTKAGTVRLTCPMGIPMGSIIVTD